MARSGSHGKKNLFLYFTFSHMTSVEFRFWFHFQKSFKTLHKNKYVNTCSFRKYFALTLRVIRVYWYQWVTSTQPRKERFDATHRFVVHNILVISLWSVLLVEETRENHWPVASHWQTLSHNVSSATRLSGIQTHNVTDDSHWLHRNKRKTSINNKNMHQIRR
jgi:hypothetical protein